MRILFLSELFFLIHRDSDIKKPLGQHIEDIPSLFSLPSSPPHLPPTRNMYKNPAGREREEREKPKP